MRLLNPILLLASVASLLAQEGTCLIQSKQAGAFRVGMTIHQARQHLGGATLTASSDGDGMQLFDVKRGGVLVMQLYPDADAPGKESAGIVVIRVFSPQCATAEGVRPGMPLAEVEKRFSKLQRLERTEIESREYAEFEKQPSWLQVQTGNGEAGVYPKGKRCAMHYHATAKVESLWVAGPSKSPRFFENDKFCDDPAK